MNPNRPNAQHRPVIGQAGLCAASAQATQAFWARFISAQSGASGLDVVSRGLGRHAIARRRRILSCDERTAGGAARIGPLTFARNRDVLFAVLQPTRRPICHLRGAYPGAYARLLTLIDSEGYSHLLRM